MQMSGKIGLLSVNYILASIASVSLEVLPVRLVRFFFSGCTPVSARALRFPFEGDGSMMPSPIKAIFEISATGKICIEFKIS